VNRHAASDRSTSPGDRTIAQSGSGLLPDAVKQTVRVGPSIAVVEHGREVIERRPIRAAFRKELDELLQIRSGEC
jgi:hypothetical protein